MPPLAPSSTQRLRPARKTAPPMYVEHCAPLPKGWRETYPIRWTLDPNAEDHCEACSTFAGEYENWEVMSIKTNGAMPGCFPGCVFEGEYGAPDRRLRIVHQLETAGMPQENRAVRTTRTESETPQLHQGGAIACGYKCQCEVEIKIGGSWIRLEWPFRGVREERRSRQSAV